jgi:glycosyltransferase involved in cell wall biosynthesis
VSSKRIVFIKTNLLDIDPRMAKELEVLKANGYAITLLCWDRDGRAGSAAKPGPYNQITLKFDAPVGSRILFFLPFWWVFVWFRLMRLEVDIIHAINFDSVVPALVAAKLKRKPLVYEIFDVYVDNKVVPRLVRWLGIKVEKLFIRFAEGVILANEGQPIELKGVPNQNIVEIYNSPPDVFQALNHLKSFPFTLFFAGSLQSDRHTNVDTVYSAIKSIEGTRLIVAGYGDKAAEIKKEADSNPDKLEFLGIISYPEVLKRTMESDLLFALYDTRVLTARYAGGNKLFESMMAGKPLLVNRGTVMAEIATKERCGLVIDSTDIERVREGIKQLKNNPELCRQLGANGRRAYEEKYNWTLMQKRLLEFYFNIENSGR